MQTPENNKPETERFSKLQNLKDIATYLSIAPKKLSYFLYAMSPEIRYSSFTISKKSGRIRTISTPCTGLKRVQQTLNTALQKIFWENYSKRRGYVFGFLEGQQIVGNAQLHINKEYVVNVDLKDFFDQITFPRIRGMFLKYPFSLPPKAATIFAQIVSHNFKLPQGAPTSPIVSNFICARMDGELWKLARRYHYKYSRYADDLTFSCGASAIPAALGSFVDGAFRLSPRIVDIIEKDNKFTINEAKTRCMERFRRQEVTGLTVNTKANVPRKYIKQIRAMLHDWERCSEDAALANHLLHWRKKHHNPSKPPCSFSSIVKGKIEFLRQIRGDDDFIYRNFLFQYDLLIEAECPRIANKKYIPQGVFIIEDGLLLGTQGSGFMLPGGMLVTNAHVLEEPRREDASQIAEQIEVYRHFDGGQEKKRYPITIKYINRAADIAILTVPGLHQKSCFDYSFKEIGIGQRVVIAGYPNYSNEPITILDAKTIGTKKYFDIDYYLVDKTIFPGNSGGPVFDDRLRVVGIATRGEKDASGMNAFIPITALANMLKG